MLMLRRFFLLLVVAASGTAVGQTISLSDIDFAAGERVIELSLEAGTDMTSFNVRVDLPDTETTFTGCATFETQSGTLPDPSYAPPINQNPFTEGCDIINSGQSAVFNFSSDLTAPAILGTGVYGVIVLADTVPPGDKTLDVQGVGVDPCVDTSTRFTPPNFMDTPVACTFVDAVITAPVPALSVTPTSATISPSQPQATITVTNNGNGDLDLTTIDIPTDFSQTTGSNDCALSDTLAPSASCEIIVVFNGVADTSGTLTVATTTPNTAAPTSIDVTLNGIVAVSGINIVETSATISPTQPQATFTVENLGNIPIELTTITIPTDFSQAGGDCTPGLTINPSSNCQLVIEFDGLSNVSGATLSVTTSTAGANPSSDSATLNGIAPGVGTLSLISGPEPAMLANGDQATITLGNTSDPSASALVVTTGSFADGTHYSIVTDSCSMTTLQPGAPDAAGSTCTVVLQLNSDTAPDGDSLAFSAADLNGAPIGSINVTIPGTNAVEPIGIPTLSQLSMLVVASILALFAMFSLRRQP